MSRSPFVSVIVTVYKTEKYIKRCLDSIKAQKLKNFEVIIVDDGSPDNAADIAKAYTCDRRFKLFHQLNSGVGVARNRGIELSTGEYLCFVDSDDAIAPSYLLNLYKAAKNADADISICSYSCCNEYGEGVRESKIVKKEGVYNSQQMVGNIIRDISVRRYICSKLFKRTLFTENRISFPCATFEDNAMMPIVFYNARKIAVITDHSYIYTRHSDSITGLTGVNCIGDYLKANERVEDYFLSTPEAEFYLANLLYQRVKTSLVAFCWLFVRAYKIKSLDFFGGNLKKIIGFAFSKRKLLNYAPDYKYNPARKI